MTKSEKHWIVAVNKAWRPYTKCPADWPQFAKDFWAEIDADWQKVDVR
jgi:hypothetical protein